MFFDVSPDESDLDSSDSEADTDTSDFSGLSHESDSDSDDSEDTDDTFSNNDYSVSCLLLVYRTRHDFRTWHTQCFFK